MRVDLCNTANEVVFKASNINKKIMNENEISALKTAIDTNDFINITNKERDYNIYFQFDDENVGVKLSDKVIEKLKNFFEESDFEEYDNGIILNGAAAAYVSGWYADIAYRRNYALADTNKDGEINSAESKNIFNIIAYKSLRTEEGMDITSVDKIYMRNIFSQFDRNYKTSISKALNQDILEDVDMNGELTMREIWGADEKGIAIKDVYSSGSASFSGAGAGNIANILSGIKIEVRSAYSNLRIDKLINKKELANMKLNEVLEKLKTKDFTTLSKEDLEVLETLNLDKVFKDEKLEEILKISKNTFDSLGARFDDFINFTQDFIKELNEQNLIDIRV